MIFFPDLRCRRVTSSYCEIEPLLASIVLLSWRWESRDRPSQVRRLVPSQVLCRVPRRVLCRVPRRVLRPRWYSAMTQTFLAMPSSLS